MEKEKIKSRIEMLINAYEYQRNRIESELKLDGSSYGKCFQEGLKRAYGDFIKDLEDINSKIS